MANCEQKKLKIVLIEKNETFSEKSKGILKKSFDLVTLTIDNESVIDEKKPHNIFKAFNPSILSPGPHVFLLIYMGELSPSSGDAKRIRRIKEFFGEASKPYFLPLIIHKNTTLDTEKKQDILKSIEKDLELSRETYCALCCKGGEVNENEKNNLLFKINEVVNKNMNKETYTKEMFDDAQKVIRPKNVQESNSKGKTGDGSQGHNKNETDKVAGFRELLSCCLGKITVKVQNS